MRQSYLNALKRVGRIRRAAVRLVVENENQAMTEVARTALDLTRRTMGLVKATGSTRGEALIGAVDQLIRAARQETEASILSSHSSLFDLSLATNFEQMNVFKTVTPRQILALSQQFRADSFARLRREDYTRWIARIPQETLGPEMALRDSMTRLVAEGRSVKQAVDSFLAGSSFDQQFPTAGQIMRSDVVITNLPVIEQKISPLKRAFRVMRTELGRLDNVVGITFAESAGFEKFINLGVGDDRQSDTCRAATLQDPMTIVQWRDSEWGLAPRHPYCRCAICAVPMEIQKNLSTTAIGEIGLVATDLAA